MTSITIKSNGVILRSDDKHTEGSIVSLLMDSERFRNTVHYTRYILGHDDWFIAGGFLRDTVTGRTIKDVDVFTTDSSLFSKKENKYGNMEIISQFSRQMGGEKFNFVLIEKQNMEKFVTSFPIGLSMICYIGDGRFGIHPKFLEDVNNKTLTVYNNDNGFAYIERITEKYSDYKLIDTRKVEF